MREAVALAGIALAVTLGAACANSDSIQSTTSTGTSGGGGSGGSAGGDAGAPLTGDAIPAGAISFFQRPSCPDGWKTYDDGDGRALLPTVGPAPGGMTHGSALKSGEDRLHTHDVSGTFMLSTVSYAGIASGANHGVAVTGSPAFMTTSDAASTGLPYVQLLACQKSAKAEPRSTPLPKGMLMFFEASCPDGWSQPMMTGGRFLVGLPTGGKVNKSFGGAPIGPDPRTHTHGATAELATMPHGIALAGGCCGDGYAGDGKYMTMAVPTSEEMGFPYVELLQCEKQ